jgi:hypothetical protein
VTIFDGVLVLATFLCSLVAGFLFAFAAVVMPGIGRLDDRGFIRAFQVIDRVIQRNQALFVLVWVGSVLALIAAARSDAISALASRPARNRLGTQRARQSTLRQEATGIVHVGVDLHKRMSQIAVLTADGEVTQHRLPNDLAQLEPFFAQLPTPSPIAIEASGTWWWLVDLLERLGHLAPEGDEGDRLRALEERQGRRPTLGAAAPR